MNQYMKSLLVSIIDFDEKFILSSNNTGNLLMLKNLQNQLIQSIHTSKQKYFNKISKKMTN